MKKPKLVVSDIDGTLLPYGKSCLPDKAFSLIRALNETGILFAPASGRQYHSLRRLFGPIADEIYYLCENGAVIFGCGSEDMARVLSKTVISRVDAVALSRDMMRISGIDTCISGLNTTYIPHPSQKVMYDLTSRLGNRVALIEDPEEIKEDVIKISAFCPDGMQGAQAILSPKWAKRYRLAEAGPDWLDVTLTDKGSGIRGLCQALGIDVSDVWAFGDNWNDLSMLETVGAGWLMATAAPNLRERFLCQCDSVYCVLERLLND